ncbi:NAD-dependent epimerase/dehydratase family protein, partial [bacterium]|nr:NAD-dependent epimerase/dehydratase family protein [bacterium]
MTKRILLTGANGFVGSHIADNLLSEGYDVKAMVRPTSNLQWLERKPVEYVYADLDDRTALRNVVEGVDAVIHNAGVVRADGKYHYYRYNSDGTRNLLDAVLKAAPHIERFVYVSSLAAGGPVKDNKPRTEEDRDAPITAYGHSKLVAESHLRHFMDRLPISIIRPPAIYGPRDTAFLTYFEMIAGGWTLLVGKRRDISITHVQDIARQVFQQLTHPKAVGEMFYASPFEPVTLEEFCRTIEEVISVDTKKVILPDKLLNLGYRFAHPLMKAIGVEPPVPVDKIPDFLQPNWTVSGEKAKRLLGYEGKMPLKAGVGQTAEWYRWKKLIKSPRDVLREKGLAHPEKRTFRDRERTFDPGCDLCALSFNNEIKTKLHFEDDDFIIVDCLIC